MGVSPIQAPSGASGPPQVTLVLNKTTLGPSPATRTRGLLAGPDPHDADSAVPPPVYHQWCTWTDGCIDYPVRSAKKRGQRHGPSGAHPGGTEGAMFRSNPCKGGCHVASSLHGCVHGGALRLSGASRLRRRWRRWRRRRWRRRQQRRKWRAGLFHHWCSRRILQLAGNKSRGPSRGAVRDDSVDSELRGRPTSASRERRRCHWANGAACDQSHDAVFAARDRHRPV